MDVQTFPDAPRHDVQPPERSGRYRVPNWIIRSRWIFDMGFRRMRRQEPAGWMPQMLVFSSLAVTLMASAALRIPMTWPLSVIGALDLVATRHFAWTGVRRVLRLGITGPTRPRWWIELAALDFTLLMCCGCFVAVHGNAALLGGWQMWPVTVAFSSSKYLVVAFLVLSTAAYLLGLIQGKRAQGRSLELMNFFFWTIVGIWLAIWIIPDHRALGGWVAEAAAVAGVGAACLAGALEAKRRFRLSTSAAQTIRPDGTARG
jgi:hypothetical protein